MQRRGGKRIPRNPREPVIRAAFARVLTEFREHSELTQAEVGERSGYEEKYISALERRKHTPTLTAVIQISEALRVPPLQIFEEVLKLIPKFEHLQATPQGEE
jgi:transcriptional regulator with XRE-family HTH domain